LESAVEELNSVTKKLTITIPYDDVKSAIDSAYEKVKKDIAIPGFRRGKAPRHIVDMKMGPALESEALKKLVPKSLGDALKEYNINPISEPALGKIEMVKDKPLTFEATVEILPEFEVEDYKGIKIKAAEREKVTDEDIDRVVEDIQRQHATQVPVQDRPAQKEDFVVVDFSHEIDGKENSEQDRTFRLDDSVLPEFMENIIGMNPGDKKEFELTLPDDYDRKDYAGKTARYNVELKEIKAEQLPEIDDELAKQAEYEDMADMREKIRQNIESWREREARVREKNQIMEALVSKYALEIPDSLIDQQAKYNIQRYVRESMFRGISREEIEQKKDQITENARKNAKEHIATQLILEKIAAKESIDISDDELKARVKELAESRDISESQMAQYLEKDNQLEDIRFRMLHEKVMDFVHDHALREPATGKKS